VTYGAINACSDGFPIENHFAASSLFSVCSTASYSFIPRRLLELIYYCLLSKPYSDNLLYHHQTFKDLKFVWQQPLLQQRPFSVIQSSENGQQTIKGLPKPRSLRQGDTTLTVPTIYRHPATRQNIATQLIRG